jgi:hypothetical protein
MEATMEQGRVHEPVGFGGAFVRQLKLLWTSRRPLFLLVGAIGVLALVGKLAADMQLARFLAFWPVWVLLLGPVWAIAVFNEEGPSNRLYHSAQPVARHSHTLARLAAGVAWLYLIYVLVIAAGFLFAAMDGNAWQLRELGVAAWVNFFSGPLIGYLAVSVLTVTSDYALRWLLGILFLLPLVLGLLAEWLGLQRALEVAFSPVTHDQYGLAMTLVQGFLADWTRVVNTVQGAAIDPATVGSTWWLATAFWLLFFGGVVFFLTTRHPDTFPKLQRRG